MRYISTYTEERVIADQVPEGHRQTVIDFDGERTIAMDGDYIITDPWIEVVDPESFEREYEEDE